MGCRRDIGSPRGGSLDVDLLAGARYTFVDANLDVSPGLAGRIIVPGATANDGEGWVDLTVGTRCVYRFAEQWAVVGHLDAGSGMSQFAMQAIASVDFDLSRALTARFGYRHLYIDIDDEDFRWQMHTSGFFVGLGIRF